MVSLQALSAGGVQFVVELQGFDAVAAGIMVCLRCVGSAAGLTALLQCVVG